MDEDLEIWGRETSWRLLFAVDRTHREILRFRFLSAAKIMLCNRLPSNSVARSNRSLFLAHQHGSDHPAWVWQARLGSLMCPWFGCSTCLSSFLVPAG